MRRNGRVGREGGIDPERLLKESSRMARFLSWLRKCGMGPEILVQLMTRYLK